MKCSKCGKEIANDSLFCEYCGTEIKVDNANKKDNTKRVDIRWALLPAMFLATIAMGFASESEHLLLWGAWDHSTMPAFVLPLCLFVASCWHVIRKSVPPSFIVVMGLLFSFNCLMLHDSFNNKETYSYEMNVSWADDTDTYDLGFGSVGLQTMPNYHWKDENEVIKELGDMALALRDKLQTDGKTECEVSSMSTEFRYYSIWNGEGAFIISLLITLIYLVYAFIAHKRAWRF